MVIVPTGLVVVPSSSTQNNLIHTTVDLTEEIIAKQIGGIKKMIWVNGGPEEEEEKKQLGIQVNPAMIRHWELEIKTLKEAPRDANTHRKLLKAKQRELEDAIKIEDTERLFPEIEMLRFVLCAVSRNEREEK